MSSPLHRKRILNALNQLFLETSRLYETVIENGVEDGKEEREEREEE